MSKKRMNYRHYLLGLVGCSLVGLVLGIMMSSEEQKPGVERAALQIREMDREAKLYQDVCARAEATAPAEIQTTVLVLPHHLLAVEMMSEALVSLPKDYYQQVVLIAPDHFLQTSDDKIGFATMADWQTPVGRQKGIQDEKVRTELWQRGQNLDFTDEGGWQLEHGIYGLVPLVRCFLPEAELMAIGLKPNRQAEMVEELGALVANQLPAKRKLLIVSSDFVHKATAQSARERDWLNLRLLGDLARSEVREIENDCTECWFFVRGWQRALGNSERFVVLDNRNSADFGGVEVNVTSYITGYFLDGRFD